MTAPILVTGATGNQGGATARRLLADGRPVRALVRDLDAPTAKALATAGAQLVRGDLHDPTGLNAALDGASAVFGVPPVTFGPDGSDDEQEIARGRALIDAAGRAGIEQVVFSTVASAGGAVPPGKAAIERYLFDRIARPTVLRPVRFMSNYLRAGMLGMEGIRDGLHRHLFPPDEPMPIIAVEDIAEFAALAFAHPDRFAGRTLELAGDQPTPVQALAAITEATGIPVRYEQLGEQETAALGPTILAMRRRWLAGERWHADLEALRVIHPGLRTFSQWLKESGASAIRDKALRER